ncbi:MAG: FRG domain-containing protein [Bacteroidetes bacterium]|nr:FRG domain-containing protein [Bacteroidota bacterium]
MPLNRLTIRDCEVKVDQITGQPIFHVCDSHALIQAAGYIKYLGARESETVYFRGQHRIFPGMSPSLFRNCQSVRAQYGRLGRMNMALDDMRSRCTIFGRFDSAVHEPLLQHYGLKTSWIDLVDNVWVALWFACHRPRNAGKFGEYLHFERRAVWREPAPAYAYIALLASDAPSTSINSPGHFVGNATEVVDLRLACPSVFVRPHAQHGVLMRMRATKNGRPMDYSPLLRGILRISLQDALLWLGDGFMLGTHALFPPPYYDNGYSILLGSGFVGDRAIGKIGIVSP